MLNYENKYGFISSNAYKIQNFTRKKFRLNYFKKEEAMTVIQYETPFQKTVIKTAKG